MAGPRRARQDPAAQRLRRRLVQCELNLETWTALQKLSVEDRRRPGHIVRDAIQTYLRDLEMMPALLEPEDYPFGEDQFVFPWAQNVGGFTAKKLVWYSQDPAVLSWARLLRAVEFETLRSKAEICAEFGISEPYMHRIWCRFDAWRKGESVRPGWDVNDILKPKKKKKGKK